MGVRPVLEAAGAALWVLLLSGCARGAVIAERMRPVQSTAEEGPELPRIPRDAPRFEIDSVTDSTAMFRVREARWIRRGMASYVVDPLQRDALVARLRIVARDSLSATALVTSQVTRVKPEHFLLVPRPVSRWWQSREFWAGAILGVSVGAGSVAVSR